MDNPPPPPPAPVFRSFKARALSGLTAEERQELLADAGILGLAHDDDPFWVVQAIATQLKNLMAETRADAAAALGLAADTLAEARTVAKALRPASDVAAEYIRATVKSVQDDLTSKSAGAIEKALRVEYRRHLDSQETKKPIRAVVVIAAFVCGLVVDHTGVLQAIFAS